MSTRIMVLPVSYRSMLFMRLSVLVLYAAVTLAGNLCPDSLIGEEGQILILI